MTDSVNQQWDENERIEAVRFRPDFPSDEKRALAAQLFKEGIGYKTVAKTLNLSIYTVRDWRDNYERGKFTEQLSPKLYRYDDDFKAKVIALRKKGLSWEELRKRTGISSATCRRWIKLAETN